MYMFSHPHVQYCAVNIRLQLYTCFLTMRSKHASSNILNDIGRNSLLGNIKKIAKFLMRIFLLAALPSSMVLGDPAVVGLP